MTRQALKCVGIRGTLRGYKKHVVSPPNIQLLSCISISINKHKIPNTQTTSNSISTTITNFTTTSNLTKYKSFKMASLAAPITASIQLNDGVQIPQVALGVYKAPNGAETENAVIAALNSGYRHIDSAARYANEEAVGNAINRWCQETGVPRKDIFVCTKLWDADQGYESTKEALDLSLKKLGMDYVDLYLIHSPADCEVKRMASWKAMEEAKAAGLIRSIGVSNFGESHIEHILAHSKTVPSVNQIEVHPFCPRDDLVNLCKKNNIMIEAYSPLARGNKLEDPVVGAMAKKHGKTPAQILLNWNAAQGNVVLPKSMTPSRIASNAQIFDFSLDEQDREVLDKLAAENYVTGSLHKSN